MRANVLVDWECLKMKEVETPKPSEGEILIRVLYAGICGSDVTVFHHRHLTATVPRIMCHEILGVVEEINSHRDYGYKVGDRVVVHPLKNCGTCSPCLNGNFHVCKNLEILGLHVDGGFAEYAVVEAKRAFKVDSDIPNRVAALTEPLAVGFHACRRANVSPGDSVLIIGGGPIGIMTAVNARYFRATKVVVAELNEERISLIKSYGFEVINTGKEKLEERAMDLTAGNGFDVVIECSGSAPGEISLATVTAIRGKAVLVGIPSVPRELQINKLVLKEISVIGCRVHTLEDFKRSLYELEVLHRTGGFDFSSMISAVLPLEKLEEGIKMQESGKLNGKILIQIKEDIDDFR